MTAATLSRPRLTPQQRAVFDVLAEREGQIVRYRDLNRAIGMRHDAANGLLKVLVCHLRKAIRETGSDIYAARCEGYRLYRAPGVTFPWEGA